MKTWKGGRSVGPMRPMPALHAAAAMREQSVGALPAMIVRHRGLPAMIAASGIRRSSRPRGRRRGGDGSRSLQDA